MSRIALPSILVLLSLAACGTPEPDEQEQAAAQSEQRAEAAAQPAPDAAAPPPADASQCDATQAQWAVGKPASDADAEQARKDAGANRVRTLKPGQPVTLEFDAARLNIELDDKGAVVSVRCG